MKRQQLPDKNLWRITTIDKKDGHRASFYRATGADSIAELTEILRGEFPWAFRIEQAEYLGAIIVYE